MWSNAYWTVMQKFMQQVQSWPNSKNTLNYKNIIVCSYNLIFKFRFLIALEFHPLRWNKITFQWLAIIYWKLLATFTYWLFHQFLPVLWHLWWPTASLWGLLPQSAGRRNHNLLPQSGTWCHDQHLLQEGWMIKEDHCTDVKLNWGMITKIKVLTIPVAKVSSSFKHVPERKDG